jgi:opacity protein-like surface antigen
MTRHASFQALRIGAQALSLACCCLGATTAQAQVTRNPWGEGTQLSLFGGVGREAGTNPTMGATIAWEVIPYLTIEGRGTWLFPGEGASAFAGLLGARVPLRPGRKAVPFVSGAVGLHRVTFEPTFGNVPDFYKRRLAANQRSSETFDDFTFAVGAGVDFYLSTHIAIRPEATAMFVRSPSDTRTVPTFGIHLAYHFENHEITP